MFLMLKYLMMKGQLIYKDDHFPCKLNVMLTLQVHDCFNVHILYTTINP